MFISWSFLRAFEHCPLQQKLIRIDKLGPEKVDERRFIRGTTGHKFFEAWEKSGFDDNMKPEEAGNILDHLVAKKHIVWLNDSDYEQMRKRVVNEASMLIEAVRYHGIDKLSNLHVEKWLAKRLPNGDHSVRGLVDVVADNGMWILEIKMSFFSRNVQPNSMALSSEMYLDDLSRK